MRCESMMLNWYPSGDGQAESGVFMCERERTEVVMYTHVRLHVCMCPCLDA